MIYLIAKIAIHNHGQTAIVINIAKPKKKQSKYATLDAKSYKILAVTLETLRDNHKIKIFVQNRDGDPKGA